MGHKWTRGRTGNHRGEQKEKNKEGTPASRQYVGDSHSALSASPCPQSSFFFLFCSPLSHASRGGFLSQRPPSSLLFHVEIQSPVSFFSFSRSRLVLSPSFFSAPLRKERSWKRRSVDERRLLQHFPFAALACSDKCTSSFFYQVFFFASVRRDDGVRRSLQIRPCSFVASAKVSCAIGLETPFSLSLSLSSTPSSLSQLSS